MCKKTSNLPKGTKYYVFAVCKREVASAEYVDEKFRQFVHGNAHPAVTAIGMDERGGGGGANLAIRDAQNDEPSSDFALEGPEKREREGEVDDNDHDEEGTDFAPTEKKHQHHHHRDKAKKTKHVDNNE